MTSRPPEDRRPRLLVLASTYPRWKGDPEPGFVHELCRRLADEFEVVVICPGAPGASPRESMDGVLVKRFRYAPTGMQSLVNDGGITTNLRRQPWKYCLVPFFLLSMLGATVIELRRSRPAVVHAHWILPQGVVAVLARTLAGLRPRLVVTSHGADLHGWNAWPLPAIKRWVMRAADAVTVVSRGMVRQAGAICPEGLPSIHVAPMGVDLVRQFHPAQRPGKVPGEILFVGRLVPKKGLRHLIDAMPRILASVPGARLTIVGFGPEESERKRQARALGVDGVVRFVGGVPHHALPDFYRSASVFVAPFVEAPGGDRDGLGLVLVEAAACGCPVVVSDIPAVHDVFKEGQAGFVAPGDAVALADAIVSVLQGRSAHRPPAFEALAARFDWHSVRARYLGILDPTRESLA